MNMIFPSKKSSLGQANNNNKKGRKIKKQKQMGVTSNRSYSRKKALPQTHYLFGDLGSFHI